MATLGLNCYSSSIRVARRHPAPLPASSLHPLSKAPPSFPRSLLPPSATHSGTRPRLQAPSASVSATSTAADDEEDLQEEEAVDPTAELRFLDPAVDPGSIREWEVDFCSRPILDDRGKKLWELVVCDRTLSLQFTRFFPNNVINSVTLKDAIASISDVLGVPLPEKIRFFRSFFSPFFVRLIFAQLLEVNLIITALPMRLPWSFHRQENQSYVDLECTGYDINFSELFTFSNISSCYSPYDLQCVTLLLWLEERCETVYTRHPGFQQGSKPLLALDNPFPMDLPDNLFGEKWAFVQLPYSGAC
ncbi:hypothetical protein B296_00055149 [Ensete ventricosum]|uniref:RNA-binding protein Tab2-like N-terminal domain-containing protein n=1 Tax=Ensete ventricosum TaxID=4639 RepID=A0A426X636_ENSVE|nr:hypothetical protein B296_00055149 [Ensete ventricosum]